MTPLGLPLGRILHLPDDMTYTIYPRIRADILAKKPDKNIVVQVKLDEKGISDDISKSEVLSTLTSDLSSKRYICKRIFQEL